jgi:hypothetical protein
MSPRSLTVFTSCTSCDHPPRCQLRRELVPRQPIGFVNGLWLSFNVFADMVCCLPSGNPLATTPADTNVQGYVWSASYRKLHTCWPQWQLCKLQCTLVSQWAPYVCFTSQLNADRFGIAQSQICYTQCTALSLVDDSRCLQLSAEAGGGGAQFFFPHFNYSIWLIHADLNWKDKNKVVLPLSATWVAVQLHAFVSEALDGSEWLVLSYTPAALSPRNDLLCWNGALRGVTNGMNKVGPSWIAALFGNWTPIAR